MVDRHYDDEALISFLESEISSELDPHLSACGECRETLETLRSLAGAMSDEAVWDAPADTPPNPRTLATLRAFADQMDREDAEAEALLPSLVAGEASAWNARVSENPAYLTAGMVRRLLAAADRAIDTMPPDAVALTALATSVAEAIDAARYESDTVAKLRGAAWRDYAYALYYTGSFSEAKNALLVSTSHFSDCTVAEYDLARVGIVRSLIDRTYESTTAALASARRSADAFLRFGDGGRYVSARSSEAAVFAQEGRYREALAIWSDLDRVFSPDDVSDVRARLLSNIAYACRRLGQVDAAIRYFRLAAETFELCGTTTEASRIRWNVASLLAESGRIHDASAELEAVRHEFEQLHMNSEAALVALEAAEYRLAEEKPHDVIRLCEAAMAQFSAAGLAHTKRALTAVAYLREAAALGSTTPQLVRHVREYVRRLPQEPELLFAPPPS